MDEDLSMGTPDLGHPTLLVGSGHTPAHRDRAAMNGAQLSMVHGDSSGLMTGAPAAVCRAEGAVGPTAGGLGGGVAAGHHWRVQLLAQAAGQIGDHAHSIGRG